MKRIIFTLVLTLLHFGVHAQFMSMIKEGRFAVLTGFNYNGENFWEAGIVRGWRCNYGQRCDEMPGLSALYFYSSLSSEFNTWEETIICPKLGYHMALAGIHAGLSICDYTDFEFHKPTLRPEVGLSLAGIVSVTYGYNLAPPLDQFDFSNHNLGIKVIFGSRLKGFRKEVD